MDIDISGTLLLNTHTQLITSHVKAPARIIMYLVSQVKIRNTLYVQPMSNELHYYHKQKIAELCSCRTLDPQRVRHTILL